MDAADPLCTISSPAQLLPLKRGPAPHSASATGASPSNGRVEALALGRLLKGSAELVKQAKMVLQERGDIQALYHDDGVKGSPPAKGSNEQHGRRPALNRKRARFNMKDTGSKPVPVVDQSKLANISDPMTFFMTLDQLEEAEEEIKRLNGQAEKRTLNFDPIDEPLRQPGLRGRKSVRSFKAIEDAGSQDPIEVPASETEMTEPQFSQDVMHAVADKNVQSVPSRSGQSASDVSGKEDSLAGKDGCDDLNYLLTSLQSLDESEEEEFMRKTLGIKEIRKGRVSLRNSISGLRPLRSNTEQKGSMRVCPSERSLSCQDRISELEKHFFSGDAENAKCTDDESEGSPDIVISEPSLVHDSSDVPMIEENFTGSEIDGETPNLDARAADHVLDPEPNSPDHTHERQPGGSSHGLFRNTEVAQENEALVHDSSDVLTIEENFTGSEIDRETPNLDTGAADHVLDPEPNLPDHAHERQPGGSSRGLFRDTEVAQENETCSRNNISVEEDDVPIDYPTIGRSTNEKEVSSSIHLESSSVEELVSKPCGQVAPDGTYGTSHAAEDSIQHLEVVKEGGVLQDKSSQSLEMPLEDIDPLNQPQMHDGSTKKAKISSSPSLDIQKLAADLCNALCPTKQKKQQAAQEGKRKQQSKRAKKVADESSHAVQIPQANFDLDNQPHNDDVNIEPQTVMSSSLSPNDAKGQKGAQTQRRNKTKKLNQRKILEDVDLAHQTGVRRSTRTRSRPLEFWLGERLVYGAINDTLPAVIGIKVYSPGPDGKKTLKVKSLVPEQYSDLVATSAKY